MMESLGYRRYLCPIDQEPATTEQGFLIPPTDRGIFQVNSHLVTLDSLNDRHCVVILGEPGIGKTTLLKSAEAAVNSANNPAVLAQYLSFNTIADTSDLNSRLTNSTNIALWRINDGKLFLLLDALEEAVIPIQVLQERLAIALCLLPTDRLFVRIACRATAWTTSFEQDVAQALQLAGGLPKFKLAPLTIGDIRAKAADMDVDPTLFIANVQASEAVPLAAIPLTLQFLLNAFRLRGDLPRSKQLLYADACARLSDEWDENRNRPTAQAITNNAQRVRIGMCQ